MKKDKRKLFSTIQNSLAVITLILAIMLVFNKTMLPISKIKFNNIVLLLLIVINLLNAFSEFKFNKNKAKGIFYTIIACVMAGILITWLMGSVNFL